MFLIKMNLLIVSTFVLTLLPQNINGLQCERIAVPACEGLGYNMTAMPNLAGHTNQLDAELRITKLLPILESGCSKRARFLLCSSLFPLCTPEVPRPVTACKSLCETVKSECSNEALLTHLWPEFLNCDSLPQPDKQELCMQTPQEEIKLVKMPQHQFLWPWMSWRVSSHHTDIMSKIICPKNFTSFDDICVPKCNLDALYTTQQKKLTESLILALSAVCFVLTLFSLVTFWAEPTRFGYPERPVLFLCFCYNLFSVCYLERIVFRNPAREGHNDETRICTASPPCLASYITTSYLTLCAATWWLIFAICFYLSSNKKWSSEALEKKSGLFHVIAWVPPLAPPIGALLWGAVKPNELTGMCSAPGFVEIPAFILLIAGIVFTLKASQSLKRLEEQMRSLNSTQRFSQIRKRFLIFSLVFFLPTLLSIVLTLFENLDVHVPPCVSSEICNAPEKLSSLASIFKIFLHLTGGTLTSMWVWSRKTCESYKNRLSPNVSPLHSTKTLSTSLSKKCVKPAMPLYSGINFHNVPIYNGQSIV